MNIGEILKKVRKDYGMTQSQVGARCVPPMKEEEIRYYESNTKSNPKPATIERIALAFNLSSFEFLHYGSSDTTMRLCDKATDVISRYMSYAEQLDESNSPSDKVDVKDINGHLIRHADVQPNVTTQHDVYAEISNALDDLENSLKAQYPDA